MSPTTVEGAGKRALGSSVRMQTWFFVLAFPTIAMLIVLLGGAVLATRQQVEKLGQLQLDGIRIATLERFVVALAVESREAAATLVPVGGSGQREADETQKELAAAIESTDRAFANSVAGLATDRSEDAAEETASDPKALQALLDTMRVAERAAASWSRAERYPEANRALVEVERINEELLGPQLMTRFDEEQVWLGKGLSSLETGDLFNRVTLGSARVRLDSIGSAVAQLGGEMRLTHAFQELLTHLDGRVAGLGEGDALGVASYLTKPVRQPVLLEAVLSVLAPTNRTLDRPVLVTRHTINEAHRSLRILVAEDNVVNRTLVTALLGKRGHTVVNVVNGLEAIAAARTDVFDVILMDVQMPEMDGLEATAAIRKSEDGTGVRVPIIALTAHAMTGDREICIAAGMDGYLTKPINAKELFALLESLSGIPLIPSEGTTA